MGRDLIIGWVTGSFAVLVSFLFMSCTYRLFVEQEAYNIMPTPIDGLIGISPGSDGLQNVALLANMI